MIDIHCHLCFPEFDKDREEVISKAKREMSAVIVSSARFEEGKKVLNLIERHKGFLFATLGFHPTEGDNYKGVIKLIKENKDKIVGIGEVGLDYHWERDLKKREKQKEIFRKFINLAGELNLPLVIHSWDAEEDCFEMIKNKNVQAVFHCFSGSLELAKKILERGFYISVSTQVCMSKHHKKLVKIIPLDKILLETDAPFLSPIRGERNYPWNIKISAKKIADIKKIGEEEILEKAKDNARKIFNLVLSNI